MRLSFDGRVGDLRVNGKWNEKELVKQLWPLSFGWRRWSGNCGFVNKGRGSGSGGGSG